MKHRKWQNKNKGQFNEIFALQQETSEDKEELVETRNEILHPVSQLNVEKLSVKQQLEEVNLIQQTKVRNVVLAKEVILSNAELNKEDLEKRKHVTESSGWAQQHAHNLQIIQKNCEEVS